MSEKLEQQEYYTQQANVIVELCQIIQKTSDRQLYQVVVHI